MIRTLNTISRYCSISVFSKLFAVLIMAILFAGCGSDDTVVPPDIDSDGDGILDKQEALNGTKKNNPCDPVQSGTYTGYDASNVTWLAADCDKDGITNKDELANSTNPYVDEISDSDGDGIMDFQEDLDGTDKENPCDPVQEVGYTGYDSEKFIWSDADCDGDGIKNGQELSNGTNPYLNDTDTDGDGISDAQEIEGGSDHNDPCDPVQEAGYLDYDSSNTIWSDADCDGDGVTNGEEVLRAADPYFHDTVYAIPQFLPKLSDLQIFEGALSDLKFYGTTHEYAMSTPLYSDYCYKLRSISIPEGEQMEYDGEGLLLFPNNSILTKTFYYLNDERNPALGKRIIETRIGIKINGIWTLGNYIWNDAQTDANLDLASHSVLVNWIDLNGVNQTVDYTTPIMINCMQCHQNNGVIKPIGPKARAINFEHNGQNQIQYFKDNGLLNGAPDVSQIEALPDWSNPSFTLSEQARAYIDVNCAHCHQPGGLHDSNVGDRVDFRYETPLNDTHILEFNANIINRINTVPGYGPTMPLIGISKIHTEGVQLIEDYINSLN